MKADELTASRALLRQVLTPGAGPFALLRRHGPNGRDLIEVLTGEVSSLSTLADTPIPDEIHEPSRPRHEALVLIPYRQITERGFSCVDDQTPLLVMSIREQGLLPIREALCEIPDVPIRAANGAFDVNDRDYERTARAVIEEEIGRGEGANFVIGRSFVTDICDYSPRRALSLFRRLLEREPAAYWTFVIHTGERILVGASPERHISLRAGTAVMNPISGTYRYPVSGPRLDGLVDFLADPKEIDELYMVLDEELKMMSRICAAGGRVTGPYLREMARLAHTEYLIEGRTSRDVREILRETMFAPTVTGSPLENACRVIKRYERIGRGYYSGVAALVGRDAAGRRTLDSSIIIRTADISGDGRLRLTVGSTLVRHSDPESEVAETRAKAAGLLAALDAATPDGFGAHPEVRAALARRNDPIAPFWLRPEDVEFDQVPELSGRRVLVVDAEDNFTSMLAHLLRSMGLVVTVSRFDEPYGLDSHDLVVLGPGPGDPRDDGDVRVAHLFEALRRLLASGQPFLAVCLSHQVLGRLLGLRVRPRPVPNQGAQHQIDLFGRPARLGFYNSFSAYSQVDSFTHGDVAGPVVVSRDTVTGEVHAMRGPGFCSVQFHPESVLSRDGAPVVRDILRGLLISTEAVAR